MQMTAARRIKSAAPAIKRHEHGVHAASKAQLQRFAAALVARRRELNFSRRGVAGLVGISYGQLSHIENAENWPTVPVYLALVRELECGKAPLV